MPLELILFDVNETLLDLRALRPLFAQHFGSPDITGQWFAQLLRSAMVATITSRYHDFGTLGRDALNMTAARLDRELSDAAQDEILGAMRQLPPYPDVANSLARLQENGLRLAALTNSPPWVARDQLDHARLSPFFEQILTVHEVELFKPAREVYQYAAGQLGLASGQICMVAAHDWDVAGAQAAGMQTAFVSRPGMVMGSLQQKPEFLGPDLNAVVDQILRTR
ncbi:MAG: haloacid dehalogenase type II [Candidatus Promineifilaceae bacterium]|nr:haloacid dehalogenase type II [Candidatus Promineifilaceae bacterium]